MAYIGILNGFATMGSNCGHNSTNANASWGLNNPAASIDFAGRAIAMSVISTKTVIEQFYGTAANKSYYNGCSTGGRQGLKFVQEYPEMFDGVIAGAPASYWTHLLPWEGHMSSLVQPVNSSRFITPGQWTVIHGEVLAQCDVLDGVNDAVIQDPRSCHFRPETLACTSGQNASQCLSSDQIDALKHIYADYYETGQTYIYPRLEPGFELGYGTFR
jgi:feruloyl esterase